MCPVWRETTHFKTNPWPFPEFRPNGKGKKEASFPIPQTTIFTNPVAFLPNNCHFLFFFSWNNKKSSKRQTHIRCRFDIAKWRIPISKEGTISTRRDKGERRILYTVLICWREPFVTLKRSRVSWKTITPSPPRQSSFIFRVFQVFSSRRKWHRLSEEKWHSLENKDTGLAKSH